MSDDFDWQQAMNDWQSFEPDLPAIKKQINWVTFRMAAVIVLDVIALLVMIPVLHYVFQLQANWIYKAWFVFMAVFAVVGVYFDIQLRRDLWRPMDGSTKSMLELLVKRAQGGIRIGHFGVRFVYIFAITFTLWMLAYFNTKADGFVSALEENFVVVSLAYLWLVGAFIAMKWWIKAKGAELRQLQETYREFLD